MLRSNKVSLALFVVILAVALASSAAWANFREKGGLRLGSARVNLGIDFEGKYTDNFFLTENNKQGLWVGKVKPRIGIEIPVERHKIILKAASEHIFTGKSDTDQSFDDNRFVGQGIFEFNSAQIKGEVFGTYRYWSNKPLFDGDDWKSYSQYEGGAKAEYGFANVYAIGARYKYTGRRFVDTINEIDNYNQHDAAVDFSYRVTAKTRVFMEGGWTGSTYEERNNPVWDNNLYRAWVGVRFDASALVSGELAGGWSYKDWKDNATADDKSFFGARASLAYKPLPGTLLSLRASHEARDATFTTRDAALNAAYYMYTSVGLWLNQVIYGPLSGHASVQWAKSDYTNVIGAGGTTRDDNRWRFIVGLDLIALKWVKIGAEYRYLDNNSNIDGSSYKENVGVIYVSMEL